MYNTILFDLDGTLTDPALGITNSVAYALKKWGIEVDDRRELYSFIGPPLTDSFRKFYGFSEEDALIALKTYREYFSVKGLYENEVYKGVPELLSGLKTAGKRVVLATSKPEVYSIEILKHFDLFKYFDHIAGATMDESRNKKGDVIRYALEEFGITELEHTVMVGDREHDVLGAKENGLSCIGVLYGFGSRDELRNAGAEKIAADISELEKLLYNTEE